jgi:hypothetical protein
MRLRISSPRPRGGVPPRRASADHAPSPPAAHAARVVGIGTSTGPGLPVPRAARQRLLVLAHQTEDLLHLGLELLLDALRAFAFVRGADGQGVARGQPGKGEGAEDRVTGDVTHGDSRS